MAHIVNKVNNAKISRRKQVSLTYSNLSQTFAHFLYIEGYLSSYVHHGNQLTIIFILTNQGYAFTKITILPQKKSFSQTKKQIPYYSLDYGITSIAFNTNKGFLPIYTVKKLRLGGQIIFFIK